MKNYINILEKTSLFKNVLKEKIILMLSCLDANLRVYKKGEYIYKQGDLVSHISILLSGKLYIQQNDFWGNRTIVSNIVIGEMFGEAYVCQTENRLLNDIIAVEDSVVIFFDVNKILKVCSSACRFHSMVIQNLFYAISFKNIKLSLKLDCLSKRSTKEKLMTYLSEEARKQNSNVFFIPFNRQQLADYLSVDRSAMSNELCKMRDEGLITFDKNKFEILKK